MPSRTRTPWFTLVRFDGPPADPPADPPGGQPGTGTAPKDPPAELTDAEKLAAAEADAAKWKALSRKHEDQAKANADKAKKLDELEVANQSEAEKLAAAKDAAEKRAAAAIQRAVRAEVKVLAGDFADPTDAEAAIDPADYVNDAGEIDTEAIKTKLAELLTAKPHWRKTAVGTPPPKLDPGQGARGGGGTPANFKDADDKTLHAEMAKYGLRPRS